MKLLPLLNKGQKYAANDDKEPGRTDELFLRNNEALLDRNLLLWRRIVQVHSKYILWSLKRIDLGLATQKVGDMKIRRG